jgi:hypothetical protein
VTVLLAGVGVLGGFAIRGVVEARNLVRPEVVEGAAAIDGRLACVTERIGEQVAPGTRVALEGNALVLMHLNARLFGRYQVVSRDDEPDVVIHVAFAPFGPCADTRIEISPP